MYFYDKMAAEKTHSLTASFFRTHPPMAERALVSLAELEYLPAKARVVRDSPRFQRMHALAETWLKMHPHAPPAPAGDCGATQ
jgi:hypothetical protein